MMAMALLAQMEINLASRQILLVLMPWILWLHAGFSFCCLFSVHLPSFLAAELDLGQ
jgi:hypothetical protein